MVLASGKPIPRIARVSEIAPVRKIGDRTFLKFAYSSGIGLGVGFLIAAIIVGYKTEYRFRGRLDLRPLLMPFRRALVHPRDPQQLLFAERGPQKLQADR